MSPISFRPFTAPARQDNVRQGTHPVAAQLLLCGGQKAVHGRPEDAQPALRAGQLVLSPGRGREHAGERFQPQRDQVGDQHEGEGLAVGGLGRFRRPEVVVHAPQRRHLHLLQPHRSGRELQHAPRGGELAPPDAIR